MRVEHFAYPVSDPVAAARWWCDHLGFKVVRKTAEPTFMHFIADSTDRVLIEIYNNPKFKAPDHFKENPLRMHVAFAVEDVATERKRLLAAGATEADPMITTSTGDVLCMLRDPWGVPIQLAKRAQPML